MAEAQSSLLLKFMQDDLPEELKELVSNLPIEKGWTERHLYQYKGFWNNPWLLQAVLTCKTKKHFQANDTDIFLVSIPKIGTTWFKALAFSLLNQKRYPDIKNHHLLTSSPHALVPFLELALYSDKEFLSDFNLVSSPRIFYTHFPYVSLPKSVKETTCKIVYICRDPKDTFISQWHFVNKLRQEIIEPLSLEDAFEMFCGGVSPFGPFWDHVLGYWKESMERPEKIMFVRFEEMKTNPGALKELAKFVGCPFSREEEAQGMVDDISKLCSFDNLSNLEL